MADKNKKATDFYQESELAAVRSALASADGLISRVAWCLGFGGPLDETRPRVEEWCSEQEAKRRNAK